MFAFKKKICPRENMILGTKNQWLLFLIYMLLFIWKNLQYFKDLKKCNFCMASLTNQEKWAWRSLMQKS